MSPKLDYKFRLALEIIASTRRFADGIPEQTADSDRDRWT